MRSLAQREFPEAVCWDRCHSYVADLHSIAARYNVSLPAFADDMSLYCSRKAMEYACSDVSKALTGISSELECRGLTVNSEKTVAMVIHPRLSKTDVCGYCVTIHQHHLYMW